MAFHEIRFPLDIAFGSSGGPERRTEIVTLGSGFEERNSPWADSRRRYNAGYGVKSLDDLHTLIGFFEARHGRLHGFRWKDRIDHKSTLPQASIAASDQEIGTGDGAMDAFQLVKKYQSGSSNYTRTIVKPVTGSVLVAVDAIAKSEGVHYTLDTTTGIVTFTPGNVPTMGQSVTTGFEFDVPVRFDTDFLDVNLSTFAAGDIPNIPIVEIRV